MKILLKNVTTVTILALGVVLLASLFSAQTTHALTINVPSVSVGVGTITRNTVPQGAGSVRSPFRRGEETEGTQDPTPPANQGEDGEDGNSGDNGGTVITGDETVEVTVVNNAPTNTSQGGDNGGTTSGSGGDGGRGGRGGSVSSGGTTTSATSFNSINGGFTLVVIPRR